MTETDILAIVAIVMSAASLGWQAVSWLRSGAVIQTALSCDGDIATVRAYNSGRVAATITLVHVGISPKLRGMVSIVNTPQQESDPIPCPIPAGGHATWYFQAKGVVPRWFRRPGSSLPQGKLWASVEVGIKKLVRTQINVCAEQDEPGF